MNRMLAVLFLGAIYGLASVEAEYPPLSVVPPAPKPNVYDHSVSDWDLDVNGADFYANMYVDGDPAVGDIASRLYLRYECAREELFVLVNAADGVVLDPAALTTDKNYIKVTGQNYYKDPTNKPDNFFANFIYNDVDLGVAWESAFYMKKGWHGTMTFFTQVWKNSTSTLSRSVYAVPIDVPTECGAAPASPAASVSPEGCSSTYGIRAHGGGFVHGDESERVVLKSGAQAWPIKGKSLEACIATCQHYEACHQFVHKSDTAECWLSRNVYASYQATVAEPLEYYTSGHCPMIMSETPTHSPSPYVSSTNSATRSGDPSRSIRPSVTAAHSISPLPSETGSPSMTPQPSETPETSVSASSSRTPRPSITAEPSPSAAASESAVQYVGESMSPSNSPVASASRSAMRSRSIARSTSPDPSFTPVPSTSPSWTPSEIPSVSMFPSYTPHKSASSAESESQAPIISQPGSPSSTPSFSAQFSISPLESFSPGVSSTPSASPSVTASTSAISSRSGSVSSTAEPSTSRGVSPSATISNTPVASTTADPSVSPEPSVTPLESTSPRASRSVHASRTATASPSVSAVESPSRSMTPVTTPSETATQSIMPSRTAAYSSTPSISISSYPSSSRSVARSDRASHSPYYSLTRAPSYSASGSTSPPPSVTASLSATSPVSESASISRSPVESVTSEPTPSQTASRTRPPSETASSSNSARHSPSMPVSYSRPPSSSPEESRKPFNLPSVSPPHSASPSKSPAGSITPSHSLTNSALPVHGCLKLSDCAFQEEINTLVFGDFNAETGTGGRLFVGGTCSLIGYDVGVELPQSDGERDDLVCGDLDYESGKVHNGNAVYADDYNVNGVVAHGMGFNGIVNNKARFPFAASKQCYMGLCSTFADKTDTGHVSANFDVVNFSPVNDDPIQIFSTSCDILSAGTSFKFNNIISFMSVVVRVEGDGCKIAAHVAGIQPEQLLWTFCESTELTLIGQRFVGSILAPQTDILATGGQLAGQTIANNWRGTCQQTNHPYQACLYVDGIMIKKQRKLMGKKGYQKTMYPTGNTTNLII